MITSFGGVDKDILKSSASFPGISFSLSLSLSLSLFVFFPRTARNKIEILKFGSRVSGSFGFHFFTNKQKISLRYLPTHTQKQGSRFKF